MERFPRRLKVPDDVARLVRGMHPDLRRKIRASLDAILGDPASGKALKNELEGLRTFRVRTFRIVYRMADKTIEIVAIGPRERISEETYRFLKKESR